MSRVIHPDDIAWIESTVRVSPNIELDLIGTFVDLGSNIRRIVLIYLVADVARGDGADYSVFHIIKLETMEIVAEYQGKPNLGYVLLNILTCNW